MAFLEARGVLEMIGSHRAPSSFNMSSYRAIWIHFRPIFMIFIDLILRTGKAVGIWDMSTIHSPRIHDRFTMELGEIHHN